MSDLDLDPEQMQHRAEAAFVRSGEYRFRGQSLQPYSFTRQTAAEMLGLRYGRLEQKDLTTIQNGRKKLLTDGTKLSKELRAEIKAEPDTATIYTGLSRDIAIVLWLMHQPDEIARSARRNPIDHEAAIDEWAEQQQIDENGVHRTEAAKLFSQVMADLSVSRGRPDVPPGKGSSSGKKA